MEEKKLTFDRAKIGGWLRVVIFKEMLSIFYNFNIGRLTHYENRFVDTAGSAINRSKILQEAER